MLNLILGMFIGSVLAVGILVLLQSGKEYEENLENN